MTNDDVLLIETADRVRTLTLNRPQSRNALSSALRKQFFAALRDAEADDAVDVVILTGADPVFCAGLDLKELGDTTELPDISPKWPPMTKPVVGAINGAAVTGGLEMALYCDILIASEQARFADTHARVGLLPTWGLSVRLPQKVGVGMARRMSLTGDYLSAAEALQAGLVTEVVRTMSCCRPRGGWPHRSSATTRRPCARCWRPITASTTRRPTKASGSRRHRRGSG